MTIEEAKTAKTSLESAIADLLQQFSAETGMNVNHVGIDPVLRFGESCHYIVKVEVQI